MDEQRMTDFLMKMAGDAAAAAGGIAVAVGDRLGLYAAMAGAGPMTAADLSLDRKTLDAYDRGAIGRPSGPRLIRRSCSRSRFSRTISLKAARPEAAV